MILRSLTDFVTSTGPFSICQMSAVSPEIESLGTSKGEGKIRRPVFSDLLIIHKENTKEINV